MTNHTLVIGGAGKTGGRVADRLERRGVPVRIVSRSTEPRFDWNDRSTWEPALNGASSAYITYFPDLAVPGAADATGELARVAVENGVRRLVLLAGRGEEEAENAEERVKESGADWTIVRATWFAQNFSESYFLEPLLEGELALPAGDVPEPFVDLEDVADVAVAALTEDGHVGKTYELTGPRSLRFDEAVAEIAAATGREIRFAPITIEEFMAGLAEQDVPEDVRSLLAYLFTEVLDGRNASVTDGVQQALGREPHDFAAYTRRTAATGVWTP